MSRVEDSGTISDGDGARTGDEGCDAPPPHLRTNGGTGVAQPACDAWRQIQEAERRVRMLVSEEPLTIFFDGGWRDGVAAYGVYITDRVFTGRRLGRNDAH